MPNWAYQTNGANQAAGGGTTPSLNIAATGASGELLIFLITRHNAGPGTITLSGPVGTTSLTAADLTKTDGSGDVAGLYSVKVTGSGTINITFGAGQSFSLMGATWSGMAYNGNLGSLDTTASATGTSATAASGATAATTGADDLAIGAAAQYQDTNAWTAGTGWISNANLNNTPAGGAILEWQDAVSGATPNAQATRSGSQAWTALCIAYKTVAAAVASTPLPSKRRDPWAPAWSWMATR